MIRRRTRCITAASATVLSLAGAPDAEGQVLSRTVLTRAELQARGVHRVSQIAQWVGGWSSTVEGIAWNASFDGIMAGAEPARGLPPVEIVIDGQRMDLDLLGGLLLDTAPVAIQQVDSVVITPGPVLAGGAMASRGEVRLYTRTVTQGPRAEGWARFGSETGDPGPYQFTPLTTPNVDRIGLDLAALAGYGTGGWNAEVAVRSLEQSVTDPRLIQRFNTKELQAYTTVSGPSVKLGVEALGGRHTLLWGQSRQDGFVYLFGRGRMERLTLGHAHLGASGTFSGPGPTSVVYHASRTGRTVLPDSIGSVQARGTLRHERRFSNGSVEVLRPIGSWTASVALDVNERAVRPVSSGGWRGRAHVALQGEASRATESSRGSFAVSMVRGEGGATAGRLTSVAEWRPQAAQTFAGRVSVWQQLPEESSAWIDRWVRGDTLSPSLPRRSFARGELGFRRALTPGTAVEVAGTYGYMRSGPSDSARTAAGDLRGGRLGFRAAAHADPSPRLHVRVSYESVAPFHASEDMHDAMRSLPHQRLDGSVLYAPVENLRLSLLVLLQGASTGSPLGNPAVPDSDATPAMRRVDLSMEKWFWRRHVRAQLIGANIFNSPERYHRFGAQFDRRMILGAAVTLP
ncbi:MAG: hypothetical protein KY464_01240 [Gemmatimonadetes bacterium]|nr:hypothetical protein [Gemmatimonadota bacterium]